MTLAQPLPWTPALRRLIDLALEEDLGRGDPTSWAVRDQGEAAGRVVCRQDLVICGLSLVGHVVRRSGLNLTSEVLAEDGEARAAGDMVASISGAAAEVLAVERTVLNFLQRCSGVATLTRRYVDAVAGTGARVVDTRKTLPGWRLLDKYAVACGGGANHRFDLGSGILLKDNHLMACGGVARAVDQARARALHPLRVEVEVESLEDALIAVEHGAEALLLDNMTPAQVRQTCARLPEGVLVEVSGGITLKTVRAYAEAGAQIISVGALTHSAPAVDLSLDLEPLGVRV